MSTAAIVAIAVGAAVLIAIIAAAAWYMRPQARRDRAERELQQRRETAASAHRQEAGAHEQRAERAEREAELADHHAQREHAEARAHVERAEQHDAGEADEEFADDPDAERSRRFSRERAEQIAEEPPPERLRRP